jgi:hypothetical protein
MFYFPGYAPCLTIARHAIYNLQFTIFKLIQNPKFENLGIENLLKTEN